MTRMFLPWSEQLLGYDFGPGHPMAPVRTRLAFDLIQHLGLLDHPDVHVEAVKPADDETLARVHDLDFIAAVRAAGGGAADPGRGLGTADNPIFPQMHEASALVAGASVAAAQAVWSGQAEHAVNIAGGLHHAMPGRAGGFCIYNDVAVAIQWLLDNGAQRVLYIDVDAHHGDGVESVFWDSDQVLTISIHQSGQTLFPGTGFAQDCGSPAAKGYAINAALPPGVSDGPWLRALEAIAVPAGREFAPDVIVSQHGADAHGRDPLTDMDVSVDAQAQAARLIAELAAEVSHDRWIATGGGGYDIGETVPRVWANLTSIAAGRPLAPEVEIPPAWRELVESLGLGPAPARMGERRLPAHRPWVDGFDPADPVDQAIMATRRSAFPALGLDPMTAA